MKPGLLVSVFVLLCAFCINLYAQSGAARGKARVRGTVTDEQKKPIEGVTVKFHSDNLQTDFELKTNAKGDWVAAAIAGGTWNIDFIKEGYKTKSISFPVSELDYNKPIELSLEKVPSEEPKKETQETRKPSDTDTRIEAAFAMLKEKKVDDAKRILSNLNVESITDANQFYNLGAGFYNANEIDQAVKYFSLATKQDPSMADAHFQLGVAYLSEGQSGKAKSELQKVIDLAQNSENAKLAREMLSTIKE